MIKSSPQDERKFFINYTIYEMLSIDYTKNAYNSTINSQSTFKRWAKDLNIISLKNTLIVNKISKNLTAISHQ